MSCVIPDGLTGSNGQSNDKKRKEENKKQKEGFIKDQYVKSFLKSCSFCAAGLASLLGAATARKAGMSPVGCVVLSFVSGMGGGTLRDTLLGRRVYWLQQPRFALLCLGTGLMGAYGWEEVKKYTGIRDDGLWAKTISLGSLGGCTCGGAQVGMQITDNPVAQLAYGMGFAAITATGGGCLRDYMLNRRPGVLYADYLDKAVPAAFGAVAYQAARKANASLAAQTAIGFITSCGLRSYFKYAQASCKSKNKKR